MCKVLFKDDVDIKTKTKEIFIECFNVFSSSELTRHLRIHSGEKQYVYNQCHHHHHHHQPSLSPLTITIIITLTEFQNSNHMQRNTSAQLVLDL